MVHVGENTCDPLLYWSTSTSAGFPKNMRFSKIMVLLLVPVSRLVDFTHTNLYTHIV
jgi:hypothetical protein